MKHSSQPAMKNGPNISHNPSKIVQTEDQKQANPVIVDIRYHPTPKASAGKGKTQHILIFSNNHILILIRSTNTNAYTDRLSIVVSGGDIPNQH